MSPHDLWDSLSPAHHRWIAVGGGVAVLLGIGGLSVLLTTQDPKSPQEQRQRLVQNLLTNADTRALGVDALADRLRKAEDTIRGLTTELDRQGHAGKSGRDADLDRQQKEQVLELQRLQAEQDQLRAQIDGLKTAPSAGPAVALLPPAETPTPKGPAPRPPVAAPAPPPMPPAERPLRDLFKAPPSSQAQIPVPKVARNLEIRVVTSQGAGPAKPAAATPGDALMVPAGSIIRAVFLSGMDAPTGRQARRDPYPALARIKREAILPNLFTADISECFLILSGYGDLGSERAYLRTESISCVRTDGGAIEVPVDGYAIGEDGKAGIRGRLVSKQGQIIAKAMQVSFLQGFSQVFNQNPVATISTAAGTTQPYQEVLSPQSLQAGAIAGTGKALDRLANHFLDMAEDMFPVIEIDAGRAVEVVLNKGASLRLATTTKR